MKFQMKAGKKKHSEYSDAADSVEQLFDEPISPKSRSRISVTQLQQSMSPTCTSPTCTSTTCTSPTCTSPTRPIPETLAIKKMQDYVHKQNSFRQEGQVKGDNV